jgi:hypothetical protein
MVIVTHDSSVVRRSRKIGQMRNGKLTVRPTDRFNGTPPPPVDPDQDFGGQHPARHART